MIATQPLIHDVLKSLEDAGIIADTDPESAENQAFPLPIKLAQFVVADPDMEEMNRRIWHLLEIIGKIASQLRQTSNASELTDDRINLIVTIAAHSTNFKDEEIIVMIQSCLCYWVAKSSSKSLGFRTSNIIEVIGVIGRTVNDID